MVAIERDMYRRLVDVLTPAFTDQEDRYAITYPALYDAGVLLDDIDFSGSGQTYTLRLVTTLLSYGDYEALSAVLQEAKSHTGADRQAELDQLIQELSEKDDATVALDDDLAASGPVGRWRYALILNAVLLFGVGVAWVAVESSAESFMALVGVIVALGAGLYALSREDV